MICKLYSLIRFYEHIEYLSQENVNNLEKEQKIKKSIHSNKKNYFLQEF